MFELLLISVVITSGYLGAIILRRFGVHQRVYGLMILADFALAAFAFASRKMAGPSPTADTVGAIAIGAGFCLVILPPMLRDLGRRLMTSQYLRGAKFLAEFRELLQPGMGAKQEAELIETILAVQMNREDEIVDALSERKNESDDPQYRAALDERIIMILLFAQRWHDAVIRYDRATSMGRRPGSPQLTVEMVRAFCEDGNVDGAAELTLLLEESPLADEPALTLLFARGRLVFLAFMGRTGAVEAMMAKGGTLSQMQEATQLYWMGISRMHAGDIVGARNAFERVISETEGDKGAAKAASLQLSRLEGDSPIREEPPGPKTNELADKLTAMATDGENPTSQDTAGADARKLPSLSSIPIRQMPVTVCLSLACLAAFLAIYLRFGQTTDLGALILSGANLKSDTSTGQWWRIGTSMFLHAGIAHLFLNVYGLWVLGRLVEQLHGSTRTLAIYVLSGCSAGIASIYFGGSTTAVGASGAIFGLMGAALVELALYRKSYPPRWSRPLFRILLVVSLAELALGFFYPVVDQMGHIGGVVAGLCIGILLSPNAKIGHTLRRGVAGLSAFVSILFLVYSAYGIASSDYSKTLDRVDKVEYQGQGLVVSVPSVWERVGPQEFIDWGVSTRFTLQRQANTEGLDAAISTRIELEGEEGRHQVGFDMEKPSAQSTMKLPSPWRSGELRVRIDDESGMQRYRLVVFGREAGNEIWIGSYSHPEVMTEALEVAFVKVLKSIRSVSDNEP